jgi:hypothetical protein
MNNLNINDIIGQPNVKVTVATREEPAELEARLRREELDSIHQRRKDWLVHVSTLVALSATFGSCRYILLSGKYGGDVEKFAIAVIGSIITGLVAYVTWRPAK